MSNLALGSLTSYLSPGVGSSSSIIDLGLCAKESRVLRLDPKDRALLCVALVLATSPTEPYVVNGYPRRETNIYAMLDITRLGLLQGAQFRSGGARPCPQSAIVCQPHGCAAY